MVLLTTIGIRKHPVRCKGKLTVWQFFKNVGLIISFGAPPSLTALWSLDDEHVANNNEKVSCTQESGILRVTGFLQMYGDEQIPGTYMNIEVDIDEIFEEVRLRTLLSMSLQYDRPWLAPDLPSLWLKTYNLLRE